MSLVLLENLEFSYSPGTSEKLLSIPAWSLNPHEKIFLHGPSGSGKTTFLEILAGVLLPTQGSLQILGQEMTTMGSAARDQFRAAHMGYIFQNFNLIPYLNVEENIALPCRLSAQRESQLQGKDLSGWIHFLAERLGILDLLKMNVTRLSVGQQQRVAVARALLGKPALILADEPTSALDFDHRQKFLHLLFELCDDAKSSLVFVSHDRSMERLFDRSVSLQEINRGRK